MSEHWMKDIQDRFADFEKPAPEGLLADVQREMQRRGLTPVEKPVKVIPMWVKGLAAAASLTIVLGVGALWLVNGDNGQTGIVGTNEVTVTTQTFNNISEEETVSEETEVNSASVAPVEPIVAKKNLMAQVVVEMEADGQDEQNKIDEQNENVEAEEQVSSDSINPISEDELAQNQPENNTSSVSDETQRSTVNGQRSMVNGQQSEIKGRSKRKWEVGANVAGIQGLSSPSYSYLNYSNMLSATDRDFFVATVNPSGESDVSYEFGEGHNHGHGGFYGIAGGDFAGADVAADPNAPVMNDPNKGNQQQPQPTPTDTPTSSPANNSANFAYTRFQNNSLVSVNNHLSSLYMKANHRLPVKVGLSLRYHFNYRLSVQTGIDYSYHSSDLISQIENSQIQSEQKLHFIGLPVAFSYSLWSPGRFNFYISAGGEIEKVIKGSRTSLLLALDKPDQVIREDVAEKPWQFSIVGSGGIQFNITPLLGIYAEPGVGYYFDNHSSLPTIYQEKPFNFNLNLGLRFNLNSK